MAIQVDDVGLQQAQAAQLVKGVGRESGDSRQGNQKAEKKTESGRFAHYRLFETQFHKQC